MTQPALTLHNGATGKTLFDLARDASEMAFASARVIDHRTRRMAQAGWRPTVRDREEFTLMSREKVDAALESAQAMVDELLRMQEDVAASLLWQSAPRAESAAPAFARSARA